MAASDKKPMGANYWKAVAGYVPQELRVEVRETLACPDDDAPLDFHKREDSFSCPACGRVFKERDGILSALPSNDRYQLTEEQRRELGAERAEEDSFIANPEEHFGALWEKVLEQLGDLDGKLVVDLACGTGWSLPIFAQRGAIVMGVDAVTGKGGLADALKLREETGCEFDLFEVDAARLPFLTESIDVVFISRTLHTMKKPERTMIEVGRILKPDGLVVVIGEPIGGTGTAMVSMDPRKSGGQLTQRHYELIFREGGLRIETVFENIAQDAPGVLGRLKKSLRQVPPTEPRLFVGRPIRQRRLPEIRLPWQRRYPDE